MKKQITELAKPKTKEELIDDLQIRIDILGTKIDDAFEHLKTELHIGHHNADI